MINSSRGAQSKQTSPCPELGSPLLPCRASSQVERMPREGVLYWGQGCPAAGQGTYRTLCVCCLCSFLSSALCRGSRLDSAPPKWFCLLQPLCQRDSLILFGCDSHLHALKQVVARNCLFSARLLHFCQKETSSLAISSYGVAWGRRWFCFSGIWSSPDH